MTQDIDRKTLRFNSINFKGLAPGPRLVVTGAVHGNETCGTQAITRVLAEVNSGKIPIVAGEVTFVPVTNPLAYAKGERSGDRNLNRNLSPTNDPKEFEDHVANWLCPILARHGVLLDLHSTRGKTQAFAMLGPKDNSGTVEPFRHSAEERAMARILGVKRYVEGWLGTYAKGVERRVKSGLVSGLNTDPKYGVGTTEYMRSQGGYAITLECGQHEAPESPEVAYLAICNALAHLGITGESPPQPAAEWEALKIDEVIDRAHEEDQLARTWASFDTLKRGDLIATRHDGAELRAEADGWILFPDVGAKPGNEWFYFARANPRVWN